MNFQGKIVIVTGAGKGIGKCITETFSDQGASVIIAEKDQELGSRTEKEINDKGGKAEFIQTDVGNPVDVARLMQKVAEKYSSIDILINNAGISSHESPYELSVEGWDEIINTNLRGIFLCSREAALIMRKQGKGSIVNISSTRALMSEPDSEAYAASKGGIVALTHALAASFSNDHIQVNCISPGWIETGDYSELRPRDHSQHLSGRVGKPEDIASACLYLTQEGNDFINGTNIIIDGGMTRKMIYEP
ncbi:MAG TPA: glucose 1-dehydrogenase [Bacteroidales bacterium]|nr:glucose 1-dehydrogenase [Bacteroidales bacterium]